MIRVVWALFCCTCLWAEHSEGIKIFLFAGQSNMLGQGRVDDLKDVELATQNVQIFVAEDGYPFIGRNIQNKSGKYILQLAQDVTTASWQPFSVQGHVFGPEIGFLKAYAEQHPKEKVGIIKFAVNGSSLVKQWQGNGHHKLGILQPQFIRIIKAALSQQINYSVEGFFWMQGESDSRNEASAQAYAKALHFLISEVRSACGNKAVPFICGRINPPVKKYKGVGIVRQAQMDCLLPATSWVDCDDLPKKKDEVHYNSAGQLILGQRMYEALTNMIKNTTIPMKDKE